MLKAEFRKLTAQLSFSHFFTWGGHNEWCTRMLGALSNSPAMSTSLRGHHEWSQCLRVNAAETLSIELQCIFHIWLFLISKGFFLILPTFTLRSVPDFSEIVSSKHIERLDLSNKSCSVFTCYHQSTWPSMCLQKLHWSHGRHSKDGQGEEN